MSKVLIIGAVVLLGVISVVVSSCVPATPPPGTALPGLPPNPAPALTPAANPAPVSTPTIRPDATVSVEELKHKLEGNHNFTLLDVRPGADYDESHIEGALSMPLEEIPNRYREIPQSPEVIVYANCA